jgi:hypothetical protein
MKERRARIGHSQIFPPFAEVKDGKSQGLAIDILAIAAARVAAPLRPQSGRDHFLLAINADPGPCAVRLPRPCTRAPARLGF